MCQKNCSLVFQEYSNTAHREACDKKCEVMSKISNPVVIQDSRQLLLVDENLKKDRMPLEEIINMWSETE